MSTGNAPSVTIVTDRPDYDPGATVSVTVTAVDPDTRTSVLSGTTAGGLGMRVTVEEFDTATLTRVWWQRAGTDLAVTAMTAAGPAPDAPDVLCATVRDGQGNETTGQLPVVVNPRPGGGGMLVGVNPSPGPSASMAQRLAMLDQHVQLYPGVGYTRVFSAAGVPPLGQQVMARAIGHGLLVHVSWKTHDVVAFQAWMDSLPAGLVVWATLHHEPEGDLDPDLFRAQWQQLRRARDQHPKADQVVLVAIHTLYWSRHRGDWHQWWPTMPDGSPCPDRMGWDCYNDAGKPYEDPAVLLALPIAAAREVGVPLVIPELGATLAAGGGRAAWVQGCLQVLGAAGATAVSWWCGVGSNGLSYHLDQDQAALSVWQRAAAVRLPLG